MALPVGVYSGIGPGAANARFFVRDGIRQRTYDAMASTAARGTPVEMTANQGEVDIAAADAALIAGILGQEVYDPADLPEQFRDKVFDEGGLLNPTRVGQPVSVWKQGEFHVVNVDGSVAYGDHVGVGADGNWKSTGATNPFSNGSIVCVEANAEADKPIRILVNLV